MKTPMLTFDSTNSRPPYPAPALLKQWNHRKIGASRNRFMYNPKYDENTTGRYMKFIGHSHFEYYCVDFFDCMQLYDQFYYTLQKRQC